ncbi:hypothetical protein B0H14DRAFT_3442685 [Mycena olivaceomarginata]|nr:hypothetical protein B0H14DRAFT_3442685 [Mycena olivaceomarginata]
MLKPKVVLIIFVSGKVVFTGTKVSSSPSFTAAFVNSMALGLHNSRKAPEDIYAAFNAIYPSLAVTSLKRAAVAAATIVAAAIAVAPLAPPPAFYCDSYAHLAAAVVAIAAVATTIVTAAVAAAIAVTPPLTVIPIST